MQPRLAEVDVFRTIACFAVILIHTSVGPLLNLQEGSIHIVLLTLILGISKFAVPGFVFISGLTLSYNYKDKKSNYFHFQKKRMSYVLIPYVVWTTIYYMYHIKLNYHSFSFVFLMKKLIQADIIYHLYFIVVIVQFYILFGLILYIFKKFNSHLILTLSFIINVIFLKNFYMQNIFVQYIFFFILGCYVAINYDQFIKKLFEYKYFLGVIYIFAIIFYSYKFYQHYILKYPINNIILYWFILSVISILFIYYISLFICKENYKPINNIINKISDASFYIYLSHPLAISVLQNILIKGGYNSVVGIFFATTFFVLLTVIPLSIGYILLKKQTYPNTKKSKVS